MIGAGTHAVNELYPSLNFIEGIERVAVCDLKKELAELEAKQKQDQEISDLKKKIKAKKFAQSKGGKVFNKIADVGEGLGKKIMDADKRADAQKPKKILNLIRTLL